MANSVRVAQPEFRQIIREHRTGWRRPMWLFWAPMGPGILATLANNDGGSHARPPALWTLLCR